jgi:hypothetical protein
LVHDDSAASVVGVDSQVAADRVPWHGDVAVVEVLGHHDQVRRDYELVPSSDLGAPFEGGANSPPLMRTGTWSQREYSSASVSAWKVVSGGAVRSTSATKRPMIAANIDRPHRQRDADIDSEQDKNAWVTAVVDVPGVGGGVVDRLVELGLPVTPYNGGEAPKRQRAVRQCSSRGLLEPATGLRERRDRHRPGL